MYVLGTSLMYKIKIKKYLFIGLLALVGCEKYPALPLQPSLSSNQNNSKPAITIILAGQSNMVGFEKDMTAKAIIADDLGREVHYVTCAVGGTSIDQWQPGGALFENCADHYSVHADAILFYQGESDAMAGNLLWPSQFSNLVREWRRHYPDIPIVYTQIDDTTDPKWVSWTQFQDVQLSVPLDRKLSYVTAKGLPIVDADIHIDGFPVLAERYVEALQKLGF